MSEASKHVMQDTRAARSQADIIDVWSVVGFLQRHWVVVAACVVGGAVVAWLAAAVLARDLYRATATLVIVPPPIASDLMPPTLTVQGYQKLLESDAVIAETKGRLAEDDFIPAVYPLALGTNLATEIFVSRRAEEQELAPLLRAIASAETPDLAAAIANTWARVFLDRTRQLVAGSTSPAVSFIEEEYPRASDRLTDLETERVHKANVYQERYDATAASWDERIVTYKAELASKVATYSSDSERMTSTLAAELGVDSRSARIDALQAAAGELQGDQATVATNLAEKRKQLDVARELLKATPPVLQLTKAMTDEAMWDAVIGSADATIDWDRLRDMKLVTEESNPVHIEVSKQVATLEVETAGLETQAHDLTSRLEVLEEETREVQTALADDRSTVTDLERNRAAGLESLNERGKLTVALMTRDRDRALAAIERERDAGLAKLDRDLDQRRALLKELTEIYNQAVIAGAQSEFEDVRLGAEAVPPIATESRHVGMKVLLGAILGGLIGLLVSVSLDARSEVRGH